jgi:N2-acetyl-L-2,4-diaminobutanoate deacetylase
MTTAPSLAIATFDPAALSPGLHRVWLVAERQAEAQKPLPPLAALCWRGSRPGPHLFATAGVHGDEYEGPEAIWRLAERLDPAELHGCLIALPNCNPWAVAAATRATPGDIDGHNLARLFPGDPAGSPTERLADALFQLLRCLAGPGDLLLDMHSGGVALEFLPVVGYRALPGSAMQRAEAAARAFGVDPVWRMAPHAGTLTDAATRAGIPAVGVEMPGGGGARAEHIRLYGEGVRNLLRFQGILRDRQPPATAAPAWTTTDVAAEAEGQILLDAAVGDWVETGQPLATIVSALGAPLATVQAPHAGRLWAIRHLRRVAVGDLVAVVAVPANAGQLHR